jgi:hypothetical protein
VLDRRSLAAVLSNSRNNRPTTSKNSVSSRASKKQLEMAEDAALRDRMLPLSDSFTVGVDKVRLSFALDPATADAAQFETFRRRRGAKITLRLGDVELPAHLSVRGHIGPFGLTGLWASLEFNPSHAARGLAGTSGGLCPWNSAQALCVMALEALRPVAPLGEGSPHDVKVSVLHLARDFVVEDAAAWIAASNGTTPAWSRSQAIYFGPEQAPETMTTGSKSVRVILYDKHAQAGTPWSAVHRLRWESQISDPKRLRSLGLGTVGGLHPEALAFATARLWRHSRLGTVVKTPSAAHAVARGGLPAATARDLLGWLTARGEGLRLEDDLSTEDVRAYHDLAAQAGIHVGRSTVSVTRHGRNLDLAGGLEVPLDGT